MKELATREIKIEGEVIDSSGFSIPFDWAFQVKGLLIGLKDDEDNTLALGMIDEGEEGGVLRISTPLEDTEKVKTIHLSSLRLTPSYEEERV